MQAAVPGDTARMIRTRSRAAPELPVADIDSGRFFCNIQLSEELLLNRAAVRETVVTL